MEQVHLVIPSTAGLPWLQLLAHKITDIDTIDQYNIKFIF